VGQFPGQIVSDGQSGTFYYAFCLKYAGASAKGNAGSQGKQAVLAGQCLTDLPDSSGDLCRPQEE